MSNLLTLFDYIYYRVYKFFKEKGDKISEFSATLVLSLMQFLTVIDIMFIIKMIRNYHFPNKFAFLPLLIVISVINWYRYERNFDAQKIEMRWKDEGQKKKIRNGWLIGLYLMISFLIPAGTWYFRAQP